MSSFRPLFARPITTRKLVLVGALVVYAGGVIVTGSEGVRFFRDCLLERASIIGLGSLGWPVLLPAAFLVGPSNGAAPEACPPAG